GDSLVFFFFHRVPAPEVAEEGVRAFHDARVAEKRFGKKSSVMLENAGDGEMDFVGRPAFGKFNDTFGETAKAVHVNSLRSEKRVVMGMFARMDGFLRDESPDVGFEFGVGNVIGEKTNTIDEQALARWKKERKRIIKARSGGVAGVPIERQLFIETKMDIAGCDSGGVV